LPQTNQKSEAGFTLLELLIVIVIIGILALLILPNIISAPAKANDAKRKTDLAAIQKALEAYFVDNNVYPPTGGTANVVLGGSGGPLSSGSTPYMSTVPQDPKKGIPSQYVYTYTPGNSAATYSLTACLQNSNDTGLDVVLPISPCTTKTFELVSTN
jgi:general secretion pathway protein G